MLFFRRLKEVDYSSIIPTLEKGDPTEIKKLLWQSGTGQINYLPAAVEMVQKLKTGENSKGITLHEQVKKGNFELAIFSRDITGTNFYPLIFDRRSGKIAGVMQAFNEVNDHLTNQDKKSIDHLAQEWVKFTLNKSR